MMEELGLDRHMGYECRCRHGQAWSQATSGGEQHGEKIERRTAGSRVNSNTVIQTLFPAQRNNRRRSWIFFRSATIRAPGISRCSRYFTCGTGERAMSSGVVCLAVTPGTKSTPAL